MDDAAALSQLSAKNRFARNKMRGWGARGLQGTKNIKVAGAWSWRAKTGAVSELSSAGGSTNVFVANITESNIQMAKVIWPKALSIYDLRGPGPAPAAYFSMQPSLLLT